MKFGETLSTHLTPEWRKQYINYSFLKEMIYNIAYNVPTDVDVSNSAYEAYIAKSDEDFFTECEKELVKINTFFAEKLAEAKRKFRELRTEMEVSVIDKKPSTVSQVNLNDYLPKRTTKHLKLVVSEYYLSLILLQNYQTLNRTGFRKIMKKHDKNIGIKSGYRWFNSNVETAFFTNNSEIKQLIEDTETIYTNCLEGGDRSRAMKRLRVPPFEESKTPWATFRLGFALGLFICLAACIIIDRVSNKESHQKHYRACQQLHRGPLLLILFVFLIGINIHGWQMAGVNHVLIFEVDPRKHLSAVNFMEIAAYFAVLASLSFWGCTHPLHENIAPFIFPLTLVLMMVIYLTNPLPLLWSARLWLLKVIGRIVAAPFFRVQFADFWLADQFNSMGIVFVDFAYFACFYVMNRNWTMVKYPERCLGNYHIISKAILLSLPAWWRFAQCIRRFSDSPRVNIFLYNAGKYASTFPVSCFGAALAQTNSRYSRSVDNPFFWCYIFFRSISTIYCYLWDVMFDFGVFRKFSGDNIFLRDEIIYPPYYYYLAIVEDLLLRLYWVPDIYLRELKLLDEYHSETISGILEVLRRYIWNYIRLEHEHLNNVGQFRAVRDISIRLIAPYDQKRLEDMMDNEDGVTNRRRSSLERASFASAPSD